LPKKRLAYNKTKGSLAKWDSQMWYRVSRPLFCKLLAARHLELRAAKKRDRYHVPFGEMFSIPDIYLFKRSSVVVFTSISA
jgi:hypothetical protein